VTANARQLVEVVARLGDTLLEVSLVSAGSTVRLGEAELVAVPGTARVGLVDVTISSVARPIRNVPYATNTDRAAMPYLAGSIALHVVICAMAITTPPDGIGVAAAVTDRPTNDPHIGWKVGPGATGGGSEDVELALEVGPKQPKRDPRRLRVIADATPGDADDDARDRIAALVNSMDASKSYELIDTAGGQVGGGGGGGEGGGFGGSRDGSIGTGGVEGDERYGTGVAGGDWAGAGRGGGLRSRDDVVPTVILCGGPDPCVAIGDLDKAIIRRYIRRQLPQIQYCYDKQLLVDGRLSGVIALEFVIDGSGKVAEATGQGMDEAVSECLTKVIQTIEFPRSKTNTSTRVKYPFTFRTH